MLLVLAHLLHVSNSENTIYSNNLRSQNNFVEFLRTEGYIRSKPVEKVLLKIDRKYYIEQHPYEEQSIMDEFGLFDAHPHMQVVALQTLEKHLKKGNKALTVGFGSGYVSVCMAVMVGRSGLSVGIEHENETMVLAYRNIKRDKYLKKNPVNIKFLYGNKTDMAAKDGPFDAIYVVTAVRKLPQDLVAQLKNGGRMLIPIGGIGNVKAMMVIDKHMNGTWTSRNRTQVHYVNRHGWWEVEDAFLDPEYLMNDESDSG